MLPEGFTWMPTDEAGVERKHVGTFTERCTTVGFLRYASGAVHRVANLRAPELHFVLDGTLRCGDGVYSEWTTFKFEPGDDVTIEAVEATETYVIGLPFF